MSKEKICPFMSRPVWVAGDVKLVKMFCCGEDCAAWESCAPVDDTDTANGRRCKLIP